MVCFDAVGTLIQPRPSAAEAYAQIGGRHGSGLTVEEIACRFPLALERQEEYDRVQQLRTSETRERQRWEMIVKEVFTDLTDPTAAFHELWQHFAQPAAWSCFDDVQPTLVALSDRGFHLGIASNFDRRLRGIVAGLSALKPCQFLAISSELGWRKPASKFFAGLIDLAGCRAEEILLIGDDVANDVEGGRRAGLHTVLLDRRTAVVVPSVIHGLDELLASP